MAEEQAFDGRVIVARTYRRLAEQLYTEGNVLLSQARAFADAADRIEAGEEAAVLSMGERRSLEEEREAEREDAERRLLEALVTAARMPARESYWATLEELAEEARIDPDDAKRLLEKWRDSLVEMHRDDDGRALFVPTPSAFASLGLDADIEAGSVLARLAGAH